MRKKKEKALNFLIGASLLYWAGAGLYSHWEDPAIPPARWCVSLLNLAVGFLIIFRQPLQATPKTTSALIALPSLFCGGLLFRMAKPMYLWTFYSQTVFIVAGLFTVASFLSLGKSFSVLPGLRGIVSKGPYQFMRHPSYLGEIVMSLACLISAKETLLSAIPFALLIPALMFRIKEEEKLLSSQYEYLLYKTNVKWRLLPRVW
ncbi:hypothetical protein FUAX_39830 (plasmid) [Fulvitalea axinellae]|uniref:Isoprenylcysteine carboxylmethyltransferase family protein n=1 Tax=Fulvitalea axinellae TaxID=1182444 RepID=A0AAU9CQV8_9BACT|nr:hypothetical protein FUAX_39830 [Fulvitalea axinellae]